MTTLRRILTTAGLAVAVAGLASANSIGVLSTTVTFGTTSTDVTKAATALSLPYFQSAAGYQAGDILTSVELIMNLNETVTSLSFTNISSPQTSQNFNYLTTATFNVGGTAPSADLSSLQSHNGTPDNLYSIGDPSVNQTQTIQVGETLTYIPGPPSSSPTSGDINSGIIGEYSADNGNPMGAACGGTNSTDVNPCNLSLTVFSGNISAYNTTGSFTLDYSTSTGTEFFTGGGNVLEAQTTTTGASYEVLYDYTTPSSTPEPGTMALTGISFLGVGLIGRKRMKKS